MVAMRVTGSPQWELAGDNLSPESCVGREHPLKADKMESGAIRRFQLQHDLAGRGAAQPFVPKGGTSDVAAEAFEGGPLMRAAGHVGKEAKALANDTALGRV
jgi:hypothetical protein